MPLMDLPYELDSPAVISDEVGGETLAINLNTGAYFVVPPSATPVWTVVTAGVPARLLLASPDDPRAAVLEAFVGQLVAAGLVRAADAPKALAETPEWAADGLTLSEHTDMADLLGLDPIHDADENVGWPAAKALD